MHAHYSGDEEISVEGLIQEQLSLARSSNPIERVIGTLCLASLLKERLAALPDAAVGQLMSRYVLDDLNLLGPESVIVEIASERLIEKRETSLVCPECGVEFWRAK